VAPGEGGAAEGIDNFPSDPTMANLVNCPNCSRALRVPDELFGQSVQCPSCKTTFTAALPELPRSSRRAAPREEPEEELPPRRRAARDDDDDDRPSRRSRRLKPHRGDMIQILGILSLFSLFFGFFIVLGPVAWIMGNSDLAEMDAGRMDPSGRKPTATGRVCGMIATIVYCSLAAVSALTGLLIMFLYFGFCCCCMGASGAGGAGGGR
jgi:hypothetical protein